MKIYDSHLKQKIDFKPIKDDEVRIYVCGPTVYDDAHLGHARSSISFDLLRRVLEVIGYKVTFVKNFTDIDDKIINKMNATGKSLKEITEFYINSYLKDMSALNVKRADIEPKATESLEAMFDIIDKGEFEIFEHWREFLLEYDINEKILAEDCFLWKDY